QSSTSAPSSCLLTVTEAISFNTSVNTGSNVSVRASINGSIASATTPDASSRSGLKAEPICGTSSARTGSTTAPTISPTGTGIPMMVIEPETSTSGASALWPVNCASVPASETSRSPPTRPAPAVSVGSRVIVSSVVSNASVTASVTNTSTSYNNTLTV